MPRKKKNLPPEVDTTMEGTLEEVKHMHKKSDITELEHTDGLTVTRDEFNAVVAKLNEVIRKVN